MKGAEALRHQALTARLPSRGAVAFWSYHRPVAKLLVGTASWTAPSLIKSELRS